MSVDLRTVFKPVTIRIGSSRISSMRFEFRCIVETIIVGVHGCRISAGIYFLTVTKSVAVSVLLGGIGS